MLFCGIFHYSKISAQNTYNLQNGKIIYELNNQLFDITRGDSLKIIKSSILIKFSPGTSVENTPILTPSVRFKLTP